MKLLFIIFSFFIFNNNIYAESTYLTDLKVEGIELSPEFDKYNNKYTGIINEQTSVNVITEKEDEDSIVNIVGNNNLNNVENIITVEVINKEEKQVYNIVLTKEQNTISTFNIVEEATQKENEYILIILVISNILIVIFIYKVLFKKINK